MQTTKMNHAGGVTFERTLREQVLQVLSTSTLGNTYYVSSADLRNETVEVLTRARREIPEFLARALVWARNHGMMKKVPILGLVILSAGGGATKRLFSRVFPLVVKTPDDLREFIRECVEGKIPGRKGLGGMTVPVVRAWLATLTEYHALKYGSTVSKGVTLRDAIRMSHPKPQSAKVAETFAWLVRGNEGLANPDLLPQIRTFEALKRATTEEEQVRLVRDGKLPFEVVTPVVKPTTRIWSGLLLHAPYMNLLRNLVTFTRHGVFKEEAHVLHAVRKLTDPQAVQHSKVLPFRFFTAWKQYSEVEGFEPRIADAIRQACETSFANVASFGACTVCVAPDVSGSMSSIPVSENGTGMCIDIAGIFAGALMKRIEGRGIVLPFERHVVTNHGLSFRDDILVTAEKLAKIGGGGTAVGAPIQHLLDRKISVDVFIGITDNVDWAYGNEDGHEVRGSFLSLWRSYRKEVNPNAKAFLITIAPYRDAVAPRGEKGVRFIYGWSDRVLEYIALSLDEGKTQVEMIEAMSLRARDSGNTNESWDAQTLV